MRGACLRVVNLLWIAHEWPVAAASSKVLWMSKNLIYKKCFHSWIRIRCVLLLMDGWGSVQPKNTPRPSRNNAPLGNFLHVLPLCGSTHSYVHVQEQACSKWSQSNVIVICKSVLGKWLKPLDQNDSQTTNHFHISHNRCYWKQKLYLWLLSIHGIEND